MPNIFTLNVVRIAQMYARAEIAESNIYLTRRSVSGNQHPPVRRTLSHSYYKVQKFPDLHGNASLTGDASIITFEKFYMNFINANSLRAELHLQNNKQIDSIQ